MEGENERSYQSFLALPFFYKTFARFIEKESDIAAENGRFTDQFIEVMSGVVKGFLTLHENGYCCPAFKGQHVAIITQDGHQQAKIWNFCVVGTELAKNGDWVRLADKIEQATENHRIYSFEMADLCEKMSNGKLKGKSDQLLALCNYALTYSDTSRQHPYINDPVKSNLHDDLFLYLNTTFNWGQDLPDWMRMVRTARKKALPLNWNGRNFLYEQRSMIQHENAYIPPLPHQELINNSSNNSATDLEEECRTSWKADLLKLHNFALELGLEYE
ncbi:hypothetical protein PVAP13_5KG074574 [Panicum virgatum]|uniref:Uncharacterized protein n=1 Tax=Panicum virgatum TaxID=38727 RepID=A0A8T0SES2_PANVG|nr:hypothetical protein PVAP13_5KG074574 [Panicum virgatum]